MSDAPLIFWEFAEPWAAPDAMDGATLYVLVPTGNGDEVKPQIVGHLRTCSERARISLREALRKGRTQRQRDVP